MSGFLEGQSRRWSLDATRDLPGGLVRMRLLGSMGTVRTVVCLVLGDFAFVTGCSYQIFLTRER